ncbi:hypothetical protein [Streptomyces sp.]
MSRCQSDAFRYATAALEQTAAEDRRWAQVAHSVDFGPQVPAGAADRATG